MKSNILFLLSLHFTAMSCSADSGRTQKTDFDSLARQTVNEFYSWYINEAYPISTSYYQMPGYKELNPTSYIFDIDEYKSRLGKIEYFSPEYKERLVKRLSECNEEMLNFEWEYEPEPMFNIASCNYLWGNQWVGGQGENITGHEITSIEIISDTVAICKVNILIEDTTFVKSIVTLERLNNVKPKISDISLQWKNEDED